MSALAAAVPLMCVPFILRIAGPTNCVGGPWAPPLAGMVIPVKSGTLWGKPSILSLPSPPSPLFSPGAPPVTSSVPGPAVKVTSDA